MSKVSLKTRIENEEIVTGTLVTFLRGAEMVQYLKNVGKMDYFLLDNEHGVYDTSEIRTIIMTARYAGIAPLVRVSEPGHYQSLVLDMGAEGIIVPMIETKEQAELLVQYGRYFPEGNRSISSVNGHTDFGGSSNLAEFVEERNRNILLLVMIESQKGIDNCMEILSVPGVDGCMIGSGDLSLNLGFPGQPTHPKVVEAVSKIIDTCTQLGKIATLPILSPNDIKFWMEKGLNMLMLGYDVGIFKEGIQLFQNAVKNAQSK